MNSPSGRRNDRQCSRLTSLIHLQPSNLIVTSDYLTGTKAELYRSALLHHRVDGPQHDTPDHPENQRSMFREHIYNSTSTSDDRTSSPRKPATPPSPPLRPTPPSPRDTSPCPSEKQASEAASQTYAHTPPSEC